VSEQREAEASGESVPDNFEPDDEALGDNELARAFRS
jgi:hypothetical protein